MQNTDISKDKRMKISFAIGTTSLIFCCLISTLFFSLIDVFFTELGLPLNAHIRQFFGQIGTFLIPGMLFAYYFYDRFWDDLNLKNSGKCADYGLFMLLALMTLPLVSYLQKINEAMILPACMSEIEQALRNMEHDAEQAIQRLVSGTSPLDFIWALCHMALVPAICEEVFFRGIVLNNLIKRTHKIHVSVWLSALLFSFIHFQFFGFLPRLAMGLILGYAFALSKSLWIPVLLHFLNNAVATLMLFFLNTNRISEAQFNLHTQTATLWMAVLSLVASIGLLQIIFYRNKVRSNSA